MVEFVSGQRVFVAKQRNQRSAPITGRTGTIIRVDDPKPDQPDVYVLLDATSFQDKSREWLWRDEVQNL